MKYEPGKVYNYKWPDGAIAEYMVSHIDYDSVMRVNIVFKNGATNSFSINSPMYMDSYPKA